MRIKRRPYSLVLLFLLFALLWRLDHRTLLLLPLGLMAIGWYFIGTLFLVSVGAYLIYTRTGGLYGLMIMSLALLSVEMGYLEREKAPLEHYVLLIAATLLAFPIYLVMVHLSPLLPRLEVTSLAAFFLIVMYLLARLITD